MKNMLFMYNMFWWLFPGIDNLYHLDRLLVVWWSMIIRFSFAEERLNRLMVFGKFSLMFPIRLCVVVLL
jgi:hypothetical protein